VENTKEEDPEPGNSPYPVKAADGLHWSGDFDRSVIETMVKKWQWIYVGLVVAMLFWVAICWEIWGNTPAEGPSIYAGAFVLLVLAEAFAATSRRKRLPHIWLIPVVALASLVGSIAVIATISLVLDWT